MNLIVYGSLINKNELQKENIYLDNVQKIKVFGFRRVFNQEPSYRFINSSKRAVLNVIEDRNFWFNGIMIKNLSEQYFENLDIREKGYNRIFLKKERIKDYENKILEDCFIYLGKKEKQSSLIFPNEDYLEICLNGVKTFGKEFYEDFLQTTYKNSKLGLELI